MPSPALRATESGGRRIDDPSDVELYDLLADMNLSHRFVIAERLDKEPVGQHYIQVYLNDDLSYQVEYREGSEDRHFQAHIPAQPTLIGVGPVAELLQDWAHDRPD